MTEVETVPAVPAAETANPAASQATSGTPKQRSQYYYWHGHEKDRAAVGDVAPKTTPMLVSSSPLTADMQPRVPFMTAIEKYSWCNNTKTVSVYVDFDGVEQLPSENVQVDFTKKTLAVKLNKDGKGYELKLKLSKEITPESSSFRMKPNQIVIKLQKADEASTWFDLVDSKSTFEDEE
jgi:hypothetical protein